MYPLEKTSQPIIYSSSRKAHLKKIVLSIVQDQMEILVVYICANLFHLPVESRDLSQAEKKKSQITTIFTQNDNRIILSENSCHCFKFAQLATTAIFSQLEINHLIEQPSEG